MDLRTSTSTGTITMMAEHLGRTAHVATRRAHARGARLSALMLAVAAAQTAAQGGGQAGQSAPPRATALHADAPRAQAVRTTMPMRVDGRLDEQAWNSASSVSTFRQIDPDEGQPVSERTEVRILYDDNAIYIGAHLYDRSPVTTRLGRRDMDRGDADWFAAIFDSYHDHLTAYVFLINPSGVLRDAVRSEENADPSWDAVWEGSAQIDGEGWIAEMRIPFSQLRFARADAQTWGVQFERDITRRGEMAVFAFSPKSEPSGIPRYGHLEGMQSITTGKRLEVLPYVVARNERIETGANPFRSDSEGEVSSGVDLKYRVSSNLTLNASINPDFGQVEVDPAVVNLSAYETFFEEKRPFFLEGADIFNFGQGAVGPGSVYRNLFYSRRVGRRPQLGAPTPLSDVPDVSTILGAAKLTGRLGSGWSLGVLEALTQEEQARFRNLTTQSNESSTAEPLTNYFVGRLIKQSQNGMSRLGGMVTAVNRDADDARVAQALRANAFTGGIDWSHEWAGRAWRFSGFLAGSNVRGAASAITLTQQSAQRYYQRPDAGHLELDDNASTLSGFAAQAQIYKQSGQHWIGDLGIYAVSPGYEVNDLGFQSRADQLGLNGRIVYRQQQPGRRLRSYNFWSSFGYNTNFDGLSIGNSIGGGVGVQFLNFSSFNINLGTNIGTHDDRLTRGGPLSRTTTSGRLFAFYNSDYRKNTTVSLNGGGMRWQSGGWYKQVGASLSVKPAPSWNLSVGPNVQGSYDPGQFVIRVNDALASATLGARYVFAGIRTTTLSMETRLNVTFSPELSLQLYAQPFISSGDYGALKELRRPGEFTFNRYDQVGSVSLQNGGESFRIDPDGSGPAPTFTAPNNDFNVRSLRGNAVLRWEWRPGSTVFFAWQQMRSGSAPLGDFDFTRDQRALFRAQPDNIFLVKVNYWLNP
ncbi:MAG: DUF5916 domain-containing protein [Longimicrobiales bacterium]